MMDPFSTGWLMGLVTGIPAGVMGLRTCQWWVDRRVRRVEMDDYTERLRALDRIPTLMGKSERRAR